MAVSGNGNGSVTAIGTENIAGEKTIEKMSIDVELHLGTTVHLPHLMDTLIKQRTIQIKKKASKYQCTQVYECSFMSFSSLKNFSCAESPCDISNSIHTGSIRGYSDYEDSTTYCSSTTRSGT